jgi:hypothetical protein
VKVYAQSSVPTHMPYLHVGYLAATAADQYGIGLLLISLLLTAAGAFLLAKYRSVREHISSFSLGLKSSERRVALGVGMAFVGLGLAGFVALPFLSRYPLHADRYTEVHIRRLAETIARDLVAGKPLPEDIHALQSAHALGEGALRDAWGRDLRLAPTTFGGEAICRIASAGPDGVFDTDDDIRSDAEEFNEMLARFRVTAPAAVK